MKELKIDPELKSFLPPPSGEEKKELEDGLLKYGYVGAPIYTWHGYIVDGHNRYELCKKHNIDFPTDELDLGDDATIVDVMQWMISTQLGRRNLDAVQRVAVVKKFEKKIQEQAKENMAIGGSADKKGSPNGETLIKKQTHTDKELAKMAGVGTGTIARYNRVMNSGDNDLKKDMLSGKVKINTAYEKIRKEEINNAEKENNYLNKSKKPQTYQEAAQLYGGMQLGHFPNHKKSENSEDNFTDQQLVDALISSKTPVNVLDSIVPKEEFDMMTKPLFDNIESCDYRIFDLHNVCEKMNENDLIYAEHKFDEVVNAIYQLKEKIRKTVKGEN